MDWVRDFYSTTGSWWGRAEAKVTERDHRRVRLLHEHVGAGAMRVLELGAGYGTTAAAMAQAGHQVTAVEISDRADFAEAGLDLRKEDFYQVQLPREFDVVCYWNGFGVGSDADQRRLLRRIAGEWLRPGGTALIDVSNPFVWASWDGDEEHRHPDPAAGYEHELRERITFDPVTCTATDTWWPAANPEQQISQVLRCYTPADLALLLEGTGLELTRIDAGDLHHHEYLTVLRRSR